MSFIEVQDLQKSYLLDSGPLPVLRGIDWAVEEGETVALVGASGAGKSTLLHLLGALDRPSGGEIRVAGADLTRYSERALSEFRRRKIGFVFQFHHLLPMLSALENVALAGMMSGQNKKTARLEAFEWLGRVGLQHRERHRPAELSGGEQQRVAIARALMSRPPLLLADEPTGNLDRESGEQVAELLLAMQKDFGMTLIVATHNESLANRLAKKIRLSDGRLAF